MYDVYNLFDSSRNYFHGTPDICTVDRIFDLIIELNADIITDYYIGVPGKVTIPHSRS